MIPELMCLALTVYYEARDQDLLGQVAVAQVVMQRLESPIYPDSICLVVQQGGEFPRYQCQFTWWCDGKADVPFDLKAFSRAVRVSDAVYNGGVRHVPLLGSTHYHATYVSPDWPLEYITTIGQHMFYKPEESSL